MERAVTPYLTPGWCLKNNMNRPFSFVHLNLHAPNSHLVGLTFPLFLLGVEHNYCNVGRSTRLSTTQDYLPRKIIYQVRSAYPGISFAWLTKAAFWHNVGPMCLRSQYCNKHICTHNFWVCFIFLSKHIDCFSESRSRFAVWKVFKNTIIPIISFFFMVD